MKSRRKTPRRSAPRSLASEQGKSRLPGGRWVGLSVGALGITAVLLAIASIPLLSNSSSEELAARRARRTAKPAPTAPVNRETRFFKRDKLTLVWDDIKPHVREHLVATAEDSNIAPQDYAGAQACAECHAENFANWSEHPHRWMNAFANSATVLGDFSSSTISIRGGKASFYQVNGEYRMSFERGDLKREYTITQTIGSRFYQYYIGKGLVGPESKEHDYYKIDFVLPFGYWIDRQAWVPIVHVGEELPDGQRWESLEDLASPDELNRVHGGVDKARGVSQSIFDVGLAYSTSRNFCHSTFALGDLMVRNPNLIGQGLTNEVVLQMSDYIASARPDLWSGEEQAEQFSDEQLASLVETLSSLDAPSHAQTLGINCEACHLGCQQHARDKVTKPAFTPQHPNLLMYSEDGPLATSRTAANINSICARCHHGKRPTYAGGMATWNSTEYTDAMKGSCYSQLSCVNCHDPHKATGKVWTKTPHEDDASCISCHKSFAQPDFRLRHTGHPSGSTGDSCMNCHMPKINEGMQDVVRTHTIFSPSENRMLEANHPNACNLCHLDKSIEWTLSYLQSWYGKTYDQAAIDKSYPSRTEAVGLGWLKAPHDATRLVAAEAFSRESATWGLKPLIELLDDEYLMVRQFAQSAVEQLCATRLDERFGYWFYQSPEERRPKVTAIGRELLKANSQ